VKVNSKSPSRIANESSGQLTKSDGPRVKAHRLLNTRVDKIQNRPGLGLKRTAPGASTTLHELPKVDTTRPIDELPVAQGVLQGLWGHFNDFRTGSGSTREVNRARKLVAEVKKHASSCAQLSDSDLRAQTQIFKDTISDATVGQRAALAAAEADLKAAHGETRSEKTNGVRTARIALTKAEKKVLDRLLPEAFATVREATFRATGMFQYDVQSMAGVLMHNGLVAEMYTGEGKTLAATLPSYLNALTGHGYHVVTVNDYLSKRDAEEMGVIYRNLGMSVGILQGNNKQFLIPAHQPGEADNAGSAVEVSRGEAYTADITYGTACEFAFDYLRDNGVRDTKDKIQRPLSGVLLDEVDSLLIDEARTPHIIAGSGDVPEHEELAKFRDLVANLDWNKDVEWDMDANWVSLTEEGHTKVEKQLGTDNLYDADHANELFYLTNALKARFLFRKDEHYTIIDGEIRTVGHSGHAMMGRRFSHGLHQALEVKEDVKIRNENTTSASITMRDYLGMYQSVSGMTGTAVSAKNVFQEVYGLDVARVPTRKDLIRVDHPDKVFKTHEEKLKAFVDDLEEAHKTGRPILVGVEWTSTAEMLGKLLEERGLNCNVLGAKTDEEEADIIGLAGQSGAITVATTRGGRGVDIKLGGSAKILAQQLQEQEGLSTPEAKSKAALQTAKNKAEVLELGGLFVMSFEHLDSRRRDDQLRGRAGRQGAPGATAFYTSMEDALFDGMEPVEDIRKGEKDFENKAARNLTEAALDRSEGQVNDVLTSSLPYDQVTSLHRTRYYEMRDAVLETEDCSAIVATAVAEAFDEIFKSHGEGKDVLADKKQTRRLYQNLAAVLPLPKSEPPPQWSTMSLNEIRKNIDALTDTLMARRVGSIGLELEQSIQKQTLIQSIDLAWQGYLEQVHELRQGIGYRAFAQKDPKLEFKIEGAALYDETIGELRAILTRDILKKLPKLKAEPSGNETDPVNSPKRKRGTAGPRTLTPPVTKKED
jgi:preprotein translocase subunit SecA